MEAKVMSDEEILSIVSQVHSELDSFMVPNIERYRAVAEAQYQTMSEDVEDLIRQAWQAGIKEALLRAAQYYGFDFFDEEDAQKQFKEWGIEC